MWKRYSIKDHYDVSDSGEIRSNRKGIILKHNLNQFGYHKVRIYGWHLFVHRLVATLFIPNPLNLPQINHIDGNPSNNKKENLEWVTAKQNIQHSFRNGRISGRTKLSKENLILLLADLNIISNKEIALKYNINIKTVYAIKAGKNMKRLTL